MTKEDDLVSFVRTAFALVHPRVDATLRRGQSAGRKRKAMELLDRWKTIMPPYWHEMQNLAAAADYDNLGKKMQAVLPG